MRNWRIENTNPKTFTNVDVWAAKASHGFPPADAYIENLEHENIGCILYHVQYATMNTMIWKEGLLMYFLSHHIEN